ncbi:MAG: carbamoyl-phosphate synthase large chain [Candidatus Altiarchaeales archaeon IMC4]|nr:MAG: carbamoyl-phosphate synthase large chain [Candidatus Altiarchaeales archaeon IMC4]
MDIKKLKRMGFLDSQLGDEAAVRKMRKEAGVNAVFKMVDTCAAEFDAATPYYYSTYEEEDESECSGKKKVIILGSGPIRIGQGIEFDCCTVHAVFALRAAGLETIVINNNPETVSTDFDISDKLYFEPITFEDVMNIVEKEKKGLLGVMVQFGGQTAINLCNELSEAGVRILGTHPDDINRAEDRELFGSVLKKLNMPSAEWGTGYNFEEVTEIAKRIGYPVLVRPSYVLGGRAMEIVNDEVELKDYMEEAVRVSLMGKKTKHPILVDRFLNDAAEIDIDVVCDGRDVLIGGIMEHIEEAGIHSGDSACVVPPQTLSGKTIKTVEEYTRKLALELKIIGLMNVQYAVKDGVVYTLEANPRSSRTVPFVSKAVGVQLAKIAARVMVGEKLRDIVSDLNPSKKIRHVAVKEVVFPFLKLPNVDPVLTPEMKSTGEVMGIDGDFGMAYYKAQLAAGNKIPMHGSVFISVKDAHKTKILDVAKRFAAMGFKIISTSGTSDYLTENAVENRRILKISEGGPNVLDLMNAGEISLIISTPKVGRHPKRDGYMIRRGAVERDIPYVTTVTGAIATAGAIESVRNRELGVKSMNEYFSPLSPSASQ